MRKGEESVPWERTGTRARLGSSHVDMLVDPSSDAFFLVLQPVLNHLSRALLHLLFASLGQRATVAPLGSAPFLVPTAERNAFDRFHLPPVVDARQSCVQRGRGPLQVRR